MSATLLICSQSGCGAGVELDDLVKLLIELNSSIPHFSVDQLARYSYERTVQKPLQQLFEEYDGFQEYRRSPESDNPQYAFRENLPKVHEWLDRLEKDSVSDLLTEEIHHMLLETPPGKRPSAQNTVNRLRSKPALFC